MSDHDPTNPPVIRTLVFGTLALCVAVFLVLVGWHLYRAAGKPLTDFYEKLGELSLQLAVLAIVGAFVKAAVDWGTSQYARYSEKVEARKEFLRRIRAVNVAIENARDLMTQGLEF